MKESMEKRLAFIILDIVAIIAILAIVLLADLSEQRDKTTFQKIVLGAATSPVGLNPEEPTPKLNPCKIINCQYGQLAMDMGTTAQGHAICECPNKEVYEVSRTKSYSANYAVQTTGPR